MYIIIETLVLGLSRSTPHFGSIYSIDMQSEFLIFLLCEKNSVLCSGGEKKSPVAVVWNSFSEAVMWQSENERAAFIHSKRASHLMAVCRKTAREGQTEYLKTVELAVADGWSLATVTLQGLGKRQRKETGDNYPQK